MNSSQSVHGASDRGALGVLIVGSSGAAGAAFVGTFLALRERLIPGADSYYHLAIARAMALGGVPRDLPWARLSAMHVGFGDKEVLFHLMLAPFGRMAGWVDPRVGGALAMGVLAAAVAGTLAWLGARAAGSAWGLLLPFLLAWMSPETTERLARLRPEVVSLCLLLLALWSVAQRRYRLVGAVCAVYALSYTAFHALLGLLGICFLFFGWCRRRWEWALPLYAALGTAAGLVLHPNFPKNLEIWVLQSIYFFRLHDVLDMGSETFPDSTSEVLAGSLAWFLAIAALWCSPRRTGGVAGAAGAAAGPDGGAAASTQGAAGERAPGAFAAAADVFAVATVVFGLLYVSMSRFATYFYPFATLWTLFELRRRGRAPGRWIAIGGGRRAPLAVALALCVLAGWPAATRWLARAARESDAGPGASRLAERAAFSRVLPAGALVAAPWWATPPYIFWAPQAAYLDVLDPVFMAVPHPDLYRAQRALFAGDEPDVPLVASHLLASDYVACPTSASTARLVARLAADPRATPLLRSADAVFRLHPGNAAFVLDWRLAQEGAAGEEGGGTNTLAAGAAPPGGRPYPRLAEGAGSDIEGYVDARRLVDAGRCAELVHTAVEPAPVTVTYELSPSGPSRLTLDGHPIAAEAGSLHAVLGGGVIVPVALPAGRHTLSVATCPDQESPARNGFYLLERERRPGA